MIALLSLSFALVIGILLVRDADPVAGLSPRWAATLFQVALGAGTGIGVTSLLYLFLELAGVASPLTIFGGDAVLLAAAVVVHLRRPSASAETGTPVGTSETGGFRWTWLLAVAFALAVILAGVRLMQMAEALPVGQWDAWAIWNLRAKFLAGPGNSWRMAVSPLLDKTHPDYPLLLSSFVARLWKAGGSVNALAPIATASTFFAAIIALLVSTVALLRGTASALLAGLVALATTPLLTWSMAQYADIPVAFYCLAALALILLDAASPAARPWALLWAGFAAGLAAWTKNEGIVLLAWILIVFLGVNAWQQGFQAALRSWRALAAGAVPGILLTLWLKFFLAPAADPLVRQGASGAMKLLRFGRYTEITSAFVKELMNLGTGIGHPLILLGILLIGLRWQVEERDRRGVQIAGVVLALMLLSYCAIFLVTPNDLNWQLQTSFGRLILQIWPGSLLVFFMILRKVAGAAPLAVPVKSKAVAASRKKAR